jgi:hypothetical protein
VVTALAQVALVTAARLVMPPRNTAAAKRTAARRMRLHKRRTGEDKITIRMVLPVNIRYVDLKKIDLQ